MGLVSRSVSAVCSGDHPECQSSDVCRCAYWRTARANTTPTTAAIRQDNDTTRDAPPPRLSHEPAAKNEEEDRWRHEEASRYVPGSIRCLAGLALSHVLYAAVTRC
jgi:hypothetical protein